MNLYGLIGYPLGHSFSKKYFTEKFEKGNFQECRFNLYPLENISGFPSLLQQEKGLLGLAVTIPYKESIIPYLSYLDDRAKEIGAVNCIKIEGNMLTGYNTDSIGFRNSFLPLLKHNHTKALVLGSGGASKAVQYELARAGIPYLVGTRKVQQQCGYIEYGDIDEIIVREYPIIINTTPVGMSPHVDAQPDFPYHLLTKENLLYDLIYTPEQTNFLKLGLQHGAIVKNGYEMLVLQAEENWRVWTET